MTKDNGSRQVTFSKRRSGIFKKAYELSALCAVQIAIVLSLTEGKAFPFGHPNVETMGNRFLKDDSQLKTRVERRSLRINDLHKKFEAEKKQGLTLDMAAEMCGLQRCVELISQLNRQELLELKKALEKFHERVIARINEIEASQTLLLLSNSAAKDGA